MKRDYIYLAIILVFIFVVGLHENNVSNQIHLLEEQKQNALDSADMYREQMETVKLRYDSIKEGVINANTIDELDSLKSIADKRYSKVYRDY